MKIIMRSAYLDILTALILDFDLAQPEYMQPTGSSELTITLPFDTLKWEWTNWLGHAGGCGLIFGYTIETV